MTKSNGIASLKQAAKLLNKHAFPGESLAYINPEEAKLLKAHGGSGIMTVAGVPSYLPDWMTNIWEGVQNVGSSILGRYTGDEGGGNVLKDLGSLWGGYEGMKEAKELTQWEKDQYELQRAKEALNEIRFAQQTDQGKQLLTPQNVPETIEDVSVFSEATGIPDMKTTAVAQGGRIGYDEGTHPLDADAMAIFGNTYNSLNAWQQSVVNNSKAQGGRIGAFNGGIQGLMPQQGFMPQPGLDPRMGYAYGNPHGVEKFDLANLDSLEGLRDPFVVSDEMKEIQKDYDIESMRDPFKTSPEMIEIQKDYDIESMRDPFKPSEIQKLVQEIMKVYENIEVKDALALATKMLKEQGRAQGGRIGAQGGGIMPLLDMGGMEKDYRQDGGFVPIGRKEKADDVPARLSKNEFVFTADAVKAAGGGDIDQGAQRMYNVMKNLEAGGQISEQSQGKA